MPYKKPVKRGNTWYVAKKGGGGFTSHSPSKQAAYRTAALREAASEGKLRVAKKRARSR